MTEGEWRVGVDFNPSGNQDVADVKAAVAALLDKMNAIASDREHPGARCAAVAMTEFEGAAMWAVKALTKRPKE